MLPVNQHIILFWPKTRTEWQIEANDIASSVEQNPFEGNNIRDFYFIEKRWLDVCIIIMIDCYC